MIIMKKSKGFITVCNSLVLFVSSIRDFLKGKNSRKMVNRGRRVEIRNSGDNRSNGILSDYRRINTGVVIKMGHFLSLMMLGMSMKSSYKERLISTMKGRKIKEG